MEIRNAQPGELQIQDLPELRNIILVDNAEEGRDDIAKLKIRSMVDWREILMWREDVHEAKLHRKLYEGLHKDEVINLQFTRYGWHLTSLVRLLKLRIDLVAQRDYPKPFL